MDQRHRDFARAEATFAARLTQATRSSSQVVTLVQQTSELGDQSSRSQPPRGLRRAPTVASPRLPAAHGIETAGVKAAIQRLEPACTACWLATASVISRRRAHAFRPAQRPRRRAADAGRQSPAEAGVGVPDAALQRCGRASPPARGRWMLWFGTISKK